MTKIKLFFAGLFITAISYSAQAAVSKTAACTAGNLATVAVGYLNTVTNLKVTGTIDARDFKTMRDAMPLLSVIDLSGCTIVTYTGAGGTSLGAAVTYPANGISFNAFYNATTGTSKTGLKTFVFPSSVTTIGYQAFYGCSGLSGILTIPSSVLIIGKQAYFQCSGFSGPLTLPSSITTINDEAFSNCTGFNGALTLPSSIKAINASVFLGCSGLTGPLTIPSTVTDIFFQAFCGCSGLTGSISIPSSVKSIPKFAFKGCSGFDGSLTLPAGLTLINDYAFEGCSGLTGSLVIPNTVTYIGSCAFLGCKGFTGSLTIPSSVTVTSYRAFASCSGFDGQLNISTFTTAIDVDVFLGCSGLNGQIFIPKWVTSIGAGAFQGCGVTFAVDAANPNYSSLDGVLFNKDKSTIIQCSASRVGGYTIPSSVTTIGPSAFNNCKKLTGSINIPLSVSTIEGWAFYGCSNLTSLYVATVTPILMSPTAGVFYDVNTFNCILHVPPGTKSQYAIANQWNYFNNIVDDYGSTSLGGGEFDGSLIALYPNPTSSFITISDLDVFKNEKTILLKITDIVGNTVLTKELDASSSFEPIDVSSYSDGEYLVALLGNKGRVVKKFVKR